jgi:hemerythrin-like domain-containing protein
MNPARRKALAGIALSGGGFFLNGCDLQKKPASVKMPPGVNTGMGAKGGEVTAVEDLMREHGVLRRMLLVYSETAPKLRAGSSASVLDALKKTAALFRAFGEDYHEQKLEEAHIFPALKNAGGPASGYVDILIDQHRRGRLITDYILEAVSRGKLGKKDSALLAKAMESFSLMYQNHAAREDTIIFPAWKETLTGKQLDDMGDLFEDIEHRQFGEEGFGKAVNQVGEIEESMGLADLAQFTAPLPPAQ